MTAKKCLRCGDEEFRINGYCSCECEDLHERELLIVQLRASVQDLCGIIAARTGCNWTQKEIGLLRHAHSSRADSRWCDPTQETKDTP